MCSGIEAASVAWHPLGWEAAWLSEIEPFPSAVLAHHYPEVPNLGDMTTIAKRVLMGEVESPDVLTGGTPCQAFSVAGKRGSLDDARGNLTLTFVDLANAIDHVRAADGREPCIIVWENVPGVLSTSDNAFGCFLGALAGSGCELQPAGGRWTDAGLVLGPQRAVAWRIIDAQYFGLAQRRRRVFVVASARDGFNPGEVLFEFDGVRRDSAPRREAREGIAGGASPGVAFGGNDTRGPIDIATARNACASASGRLDFESETFLVQPTCATIDASYGRLQGCSGQDMNHGHSHLVPATAHTLRAEGFDASEDGTGRGTPLVPVAVGVDCYNGALTGEVAATMGTSGSPVNSAGPQVMAGMAVRRLTPRECERLQGFPDDYTLIPWRGKPADLCPDGPRYKALGNSWAVPVARWVGRRVAEVLA